MPVSGRFLLVRLLPALQVPNFKAAATTHQCHFAFQPDFLAKFFRQHEPALFVSGAVLRPRMQLAKKYPSIARGNVRIGFSGRAHARKFFRRHDQEKLMIRFRKNDELFGAIPPPAGRNSDAVLVVNEMTELAGVESLRWRNHWRAEEV